MGSSAGNNQLERERSRQKILESAVFVFDTHGLDSSSIAEITQHAGVSQGLVHYYFGSKSRLASAVVTLWMAKQDVLPGGATTGGIFLAGIIDEALLDTTDAFPLQRVVSAMKVQASTKHLFAEADEALGGLSRRRDLRIQEAFEERGALDPAMERMKLQSLLEGVVATQATPGDSLPMEETRLWIYSLWDLPKPSTPLQAAPDLLDELEDPDFPILPL
jgi:AcrR family transcriptional regulator